MKGIIGSSTQIRSIYYQTGLYNPVTMNKFKTILKFSKSDVASFRLSVIEFHKEYGTKATRDAYGISKSTIYNWRSRYLKRRKDLKSLIPLSRTPINKRSMSINPLIIEFIREMRRVHRRLGKEKIKPDLDAYCREQNIDTISESTIGKVIKRYSITFPVKAYHDPSRKHMKKNNRQRVRYSPKGEEMGYIEIDTIVKFVDGLKLYVFNGIDIKTKFEFAYGYKTLNSKNAKDFLIKFLTVFPSSKPIFKVQTDNGLEYLKEFDDFLRLAKIEHLYIYPRCPKINSIVERANRSLQEEFIDDHISTFITKGLHEFNKELIDHLIWYNTKRVHKSLGNVSPMDYITNLLSQSNMYATRTLY